MKYRTMKWSIFRWSFLLVLFNCAKTNGYNSNCDVNNTMFVSEGSTSKFEFHTDRYEHIVFTKSSSPGGRLIYIRIYSRIEEVFFRDSDMRNRTTVTNITENNGLRITIVLYNSSMSDNGTYIAEYTQPQHCWINMIMNIKTNPSGPVIAEKAVRIYANPTSSLLVRPVLNASVIWLLDGSNINQTADFLPLDGVLWIANVDRNLHGRNVTYRAIRDDGNTTEVNITLAVKYGPDWPLILSPKKTSYVLKSGELMPDVSCSSECNPPCKTDWVPQSDDHVLRLGQVSASTAGEYTCTAVGPKGSVSRSIYIQVIDDWSITLHPPKIAYFLTAGDTMPNITCSATCFPPCDVTWDRLNTGRVLSLGTVTVNMSGDYVCRAIHKDSQKILMTTVIIKVIEKITLNGRDQTIALAIIGSFQAVTTFTIGICGVLYCIQTRRRNGLCCQQCIGGQIWHKLFDKWHRQRNKTSKPKTTSKYNEPSHYEDLDNARRYFPSVIELHHNTKQDTKEGQDQTYVNTAICK